MEFRSNSESLCVERSERLEHALDSKDKKWIRTALAEYEEAKGGRVETENDLVAIRAREELQKTNPWNQ